MGTIVRLTGMAVLLMVLQINASGILAAKAQATTTSDLLLGSKLSLTLNFSNETHEKDPPVPPGNPSTEGAGGRG